MTHLPLTDSLQPSTMAETVSNRMPTLPSAECLIELVGVDHLDDAAVAEGLKVAVRDAGLL